MTVVELQTLLDRSTKNMGSGMNSVVKESALEVIRRAYEKGIYVQLSAGFRSYAEQNGLYAKGRTKPGSVVTNARGGYSNHNFGLAVDYFLTDKEGKIAHWDIRKDMNANQVADWVEVANIAKSLGFSWGGDWKSFPDYPHLEMTGGLSTAQLRAGSRPRLVSKVSNTVAAGTSKPVPAATTSESIVDYLNSKKVDSSFANRNKIAAAHGIKNYTGTAAQNSQLLELVKKNGIEPKKNKTKPKTQLVIDGKWGPDTTRELQKYFKTTQDGVISGQPNNASTRNIPSAKFGSSGSNLIKAMQKWAGTPQDGKISEVSMLVKFLQKRFGTPRDGKVSKVSLMVKELQRRLNAGKL